MVFACWRFALALAVSASGNWRDDGSAVQESTNARAAPEAPVTRETPVPPRRPGEATEKPAPIQPRLRIDIERAIADAMARDPSLGLPRFEEKIEVRDVYQEALEERLRGVDLGCGASQTGAPTALEMNPYRGATVPPHADFLAAGRAIAKGLRKLLGSKKPRYFLYAVHQQESGATKTTPPSPPARVTEGPPAAAGLDTAGGARRAAPSASAGDAVSYVLRESPITEHSRSSVPGTRWELMASFRERGDAVVALDRARRGFATLQRAHEDGRLPPWVSTTCRPPRIR